MKQCLGSHNVIPRTAVFLLTFVVTAFSAPYATGLVLCICHDGHVSVEANCNPAKCCPDVSCGGDGPDEPVYTSPPAGHHCLDLILESTTPRARSARQDGSLTQGQPEVRALPVTLRIAPVFAAPRPLAAGRSVAAPAFHPFNRSVVLTI